MKPHSMIVMLFILLASCKDAPASTPIPLLEFKPGMIDSKLYKGKIKHGKRWKDARGENVIILTQSDVYWKDIYDATRSVRLYAYHFLRTQDSTWDEAWKMNDMVDDCAWDIHCEFFENSLTVTDLDGDGLAEVAFAYALSCKGDGQPGEKKLVFFEGIDRYSIKGTTSYFEKKKKAPADKVTEKKFDDAPDAFVDYASEQWKKLGNTKYSK
jgi:hypothetical protein